MAGDDQRHPIHLFNAWSELEGSLKSICLVCLLLDFDGTLSPFASRPSLASLPAATKGVLTALSRDSRFRIGVISGRSLEDVRLMVGIEGLFYAGNHGLEIVGPALSFVHPEAARAAPAVKACASSLASLLRGFKGAIVEDKGLTASVHYRLVEEAEVEALLRAVEGEVARHGGLDLRHGKRVVEIRPKIEWGKGKAAELILERIGDSPLPVYVGDDETDEEAFRSPMIPWTVRVMESDVPTGARYSLRSVEEVRLFLERLLHWSARQQP